MDIKSLCSTFFYSILVLFIAFLIVKYNEFIIATTPPRFDVQRQVEYTKKLDNLQRNGSVTSEGWARHAIWTYKREYIRHSSLFIKEWDYYITYIEKHNIWFAITISDLGYSSLIALSVIDCNINKTAQLEDLSILSLGNLNLPNNSLIDYEMDYNGKMKIMVRNKNRHRTISVESENFALPNGENGLNISLEMEQRASMESINIQTTWAHNRKLFYLNEKINGMKPNDGFYKIGNSINGEIELNNQENIFTTLDWGRGVWAYSGTWYWSSATGIINGSKVGFNLGYGFSDRSPATENCIFYNDKIHKLSQVEFVIPNDEKDLCEKDKPWIIKSDNDRINLKFWPQVNRQSKFNYLIIKSEQNQVFGVFEGELVLDHGEKIYVKNLHGFAEKVSNKW
jgi:hypothetical protein